MVDSTWRRLALSYATVVAIALLLLGPILYVRFADQLAAASDATLRLAAQRQAALTLATSTDITLGVNPHLRPPSSLADRDVFYLLLTPGGGVRDNPNGIHQAGLPDLRAAMQAQNHGYGIFSTLVTRDAGEIRLFTVPLLRANPRRVVGLVQAGHALTALNVANHDLLAFLVQLGAAAVLAATVGGLFLARQAMRPIQAVFTAQRNFIADASHELRTPLTLVRTNAEVLLEAEAVADPADRALVEDIVTETAHMGRLVADLLTLARLDTGALALAHESVDLAPLVATACRQMARLAERHGVEVQCGALAPVQVVGDAGRLEQVLLILLDNAVKYNRVGGMVTTTLRRSGTQVALVIQDTGVGIPAADLPRLFARFHRGQASRTAIDGHGLGLAIAAGIVRAHHGRLLAASQVGVGSTFTVLLPLSASRKTGWLPWPRGPWLWRRGRSAR